MAENLHSLSGDYLREQREQQEEFRLQLANQMQQDPERSRRILSVGLATGLPDEIVDADLDNLEKEVKTREFDLDTWRKESPAWATYASENPYHLSVLKEDQETMGDWERAWKPISLGWEQTWATVEQAKLQTRKIDGTAQEGDEERLAELKKITEIPHEFGAENAFAKLLVKNVKMLGPTLHSMSAGVQVGIATSATFAYAAGLAGQAGPQAAFPEELVTIPAAAALGFKVGFAGGAGSAAFDLERGFAYEEYIEMGIDPQTAKYAANSVGLVNAGLESLSLGVAIKHIPWLKGGARSLAKKFTGEVLSRPTVMKATAALAGNFGEVLGAEIVTEVMQETVTAVTGELVRDPGQGTPLTMESYIDRMAETAVAVMQGALIVSAMGPGMSYYSDVRRAQAAENMAAAYRALGDASKNSTTRQNLKPKYLEFVERMTKDGDIDGFDIDVEKFDTYFHENDLDADEVAAELGIDAEELAEARLSGGTISMPVVAYADKIAPTEHHNGLVPHLKVRDEMSAHEAELFRKNNPEIVEAMEKLVAPEVESDAAKQILNDLTGQLVALGYDPDTARTSAYALLGIPNLAERMGMDPMELFEMRLEGVTGALPEALGPRDSVDVNLDPILDRLRAGDIPTQRDIFGESLVDFIAGKGALAPDSELDSRDFIKQLRDQGKFVATQEGGETLDGLAEAAHEAGYIPARDVDMLIEAIERELAGEAQFGSRAADSTLQDLAGKLEEAAQFFDMEGIDLETLTNAEVRELLEGINTLDQMDEDAYDEWHQVFAVLVEDGENIDLIPSLLAAMPRVFEDQNFGNMTFADTVQVGKDGEVLNIDESVQKKFDEAVERRNLLKQLMDCVDGS